MARPLPHGAAACPAGACSPRPTHGAVVATGTPAELKARLPAGRIKLRFAEEDLLAAAAALFGGATRADDGLSLTLAGEGTVAGLRDVLDRLEGHHVPVEGLSMSAPDLGRW